MRIILDVKASEGQTEALQQLSALYAALDWDRDLSTKKSGHHVGVRVRRGGEFTITRTKQGFSVRRAV